MAKFLGSSFLVLGLIVITLLPIATLACYGVDHGSLLINAYEHSCPEAEAIIFAWVGKAVVQVPPRMAALLLRLHFLDCFVNSGGPGWDVEMGRRDSLSADKTAANNNIPAQTSDIATLTAKFQNLNDMVALSGAHTIGKARCSSFSSRLQSSSVYNTPGTDPAFLASLQQPSTETSNSTKAELDLVTPGTIVNQHFVNLVSGQGILTSDQVLVSDNCETHHLVELYAENQFSLFDDFRMAMVKIGRINPILGENGVIRSKSRCPDP